MKYEQTSEETVQTEKAKTEFIFRNCQLANRFEPHIKFKIKPGLNDHIIDIMWKFVDKKFIEWNVCTSQIACDCGETKNNV